VSTEPVDEVGRLFGEATQAHGRGDVERAEGIYRQVLQREAHHPGALLNLGILAQQQGRAEEALHWLTRADKASPRNSIILNTLGNTFRALGRSDQAVSAYRSALAEQPGNVNTLCNLASQLEDRGELSQAEECFRKAVELEPADVGAWLGLGATILVQNKGDEALRCLRRAMELAPGNVAVRIRCGSLLYETNRYNHALEIFENVVAEHPDHMAAHDGIYKSYVKLGRGTDAVDACRTAIAHNPSSETLYCNLGLALLQKGDLKEAIAACEKAIGLNGDFAGAYNCLGLVQMSGGDSEAAAKSFQKALSLDPENMAYSFNFSRVRRFSDADRSEIDRIETLLERRQSSGNDCADLHFALGKIYDDCEIYTKAFEHYVEANRSVSKRVRFHGQKFQGWCSRLHEVFTPEFFRSRGETGDPSTRPIFIVGMPRSGTTLVEQIIASHPQVHGAGELMKVNAIIDNMEARHGGPGSYPDCMRTIDDDALTLHSREYLEFVSALNAEATHVTDKLPENFFHLGFIAMLLPNAHIVHCRRDAMDVCLSNFTQRFFQGHNYSYDLGDIATYYLEYEKVMAHWRKVLPKTILEIDYESLINDQEGATRKLISFCRLPWDDRCLAFHQTKRAVNTASDWQVRRPIYRSSMKRWKNYEPYLDELEAKLGYVENE